MFKILGVFFFVLLVEVPFIVADVLYDGSNFISTFVSGSAVTIMGTILALNVATSTFLVGHLSNIEILVQKTVFTSTKKQLKHNVYLTLFLFVFYLLILVFKPVLVVNISVYSKLIEKICIYLSFYVFLLYLFALFELTRCVFKINLDGLLGKQK